MHLLRTRVAALLACLASACAHPTPRPQDSAMPAPPESRYPGLHMQDEVPDMSPAEMGNAIEKMRSSGSSQVMLTERGTFFGYHVLVVDYRSLMAMNASGFPVIYDATHSVQQPSIGTQSGGKPEYIEKLARAAVAIGVNGIFFETHPNPKEAKSDAATQLCLDDADNFISNMYQLNKYIKERLSD